MSYWKLWPVDRVRGQYAAARWTTSSGAATAPNLADGNPATLWVAGASTPVLYFRLGAAHSVTAFAVANHNWKGRTLTFYDSENATDWTQLATFTVPFNQDFLYAFSTSYVADSGKYWKLTLTGDSTAYAGIFSLLCDYGYNHEGTFGTGGVLTLGNEGGVRHPIGRSLVPDAAAVKTVGGFRQLTRMAAPLNTFSLNLGDLRDGSNQEWWVIRNSFENASDPQGGGVYINPGWAKGVWLTSDEHTPGAATFMDAWYCQPMGGLDYQIVKAGGRVSASINLQTLSTGI
jgi:hypothetical protein